MKKGLLRVAAAVCAAAIGGATPASALVINLIDIGGVNGSPAANGFAVAARYWQSVLTNDVTMNINVGFSDLGPDVLGGTRTALYTDIPVSTYYGLLASNATKSVIDRAALATLPALDANGGVQVLVPNYFDPATQDGIIAGYDTRLAPTDAAIGNSIGIASANVKALVNDSAFGATDVDAQIQFSSTFGFDFDPTDGIDNDRYDFIGVAIHEIGHALGFLSGVQDFDYSFGQTGFNPDDFWWGYAADLFRYSAPGKLDWTYGTASYFSLNGGRTPYIDGFWSTGEVNGDGYQASHWKEPAFPCVESRGIMNPFTCNGQTDQVEGLDLALLDTIGWNVNFNVNANRGYTFTTAQAFTAFAGVPEAATWAQMILGFGVMGGAMRVRRRHATVRLATA